MESNQHQDINQMFGKSGIDYLDDESVAWMDENYDATPQTIMLESIRDDIFCQTNQKRKWTLKNYFRKNKTRPYSHNRL